MGLKSQFSECVLTVKITLTVHAHLSSSRTGAERQPAAGRVFVDAPSTSVQASVGSVGYQALVPRRRRSWVLPIAALLVSGLSSRGRGDA